MFAFFALLLLLVPLSFGMFSTGDESAEQDQDQPNDPPNETSNEPTEGDDLLYGGNSSDDIRALGGDDIVYGGNAGDTIYGEDGDDELRGQKGNDTLYGYAGDDTLIGGTGDDELYGDHWQIGSAALEDGTGNLTYGDDVLKGGAGDDLLAGNAGMDTMIGGNGDDRIWDYDLAFFEGANPSNVDGGKGEDEIFVDGGSTITGGADADTIFVNQVIDRDELTVITDFDPDEDELTLQVTLSESEDGDYDEEYAFVETEDGTGTDLLLNGTAIVRFEGITGLSEDDFEIFSQFPAEVNGETLDGGDLSTTLLGGYGENTINGGAGDDTILADGEDAIITAFGEEGDDTLIGNGGYFFQPDWDDGGEPQWFRFENVDTLDGGAGNDTLIAYNGGNLTGGEGEDTFEVRAEPVLRDGESFPIATITDFDPAEDTIEVTTTWRSSDLVDEPLSLQTWEDGEGSDLYWGDILIASIAGGQSLTLDEIRDLRAAGV